MSRIREVNIDQLNFFPLSLVSVSRYLYGKIIQQIKKQYARKIEKITKKKIMGVMSLHPEQYRNIVIALKRKLELSVAIDDVSSDGVVKVCLVFPISGEAGQIEVLLLEVAKEVNLLLDDNGELFPESPTAKGNSLIIKITLGGSSKPHRVQHPNPINGGKGQKYFICVVEKYPSLH